VLGLDQFYRNRSRADGVQTWCKECAVKEAKRKRALSLDYEYRRVRSTRPRTLYDLLSQQKTFDMRYEVVFRALGAWIESNIITRGEAEAIYLRAVELMPYPEIAHYIGCHHTTVMHAYRKGIAKLQQAFADQVSEACGYEYRGSE
jgi:predicted DNA-binding protein (UPF0251 family)